MPAPTTQREFALDVLRQLRNAGHEALWAGGCVRDQLLGRTPKDYDVATSARPEVVQDLFGRRRTRAIGASFGVISVTGPRSLAPVEVATFRTDGVYADGRRPESVAYTDAEHDAQRRDFTINGLFFDPLADRVVDYVGGVADLEAKIVRAIGDPVRRFTEDKLRMLRAVRFTATYGFALDEATLAAIQAMASEVRVVSYERIAAELRRMLVHASRAHSVELLAESQLIGPLLPEAAPHAAARDAAWQAALSRLMALDEAEFPLALAAWFLGLVDADATRQVGRRWKLSNREIDRTSWLVRHAPTILHAADAPWSRLQRLLAHEGGADLVALAAASLPADEPGLTRVRACLAQPAAVWNPPPLVTGDDLLAAGIRAGRQFAELLDHLRDEQLEGRLSTRDAALAAARDWLAAHAP
jgi:tRNA nucleotidyltransferase/poly(A) polymerase